jgi:hypothetical protein
MTFNPWSGDGLVLAKKNIYIYGNYTGKGQIPEAL